MIKALFHVWEVLLQHTSAKQSPVCHVLRWRSFLCHLPQSEKTRTVSKSTHRGFTCLQLSPSHHWVVWGDSHPSELVFTRVCLWVFYLGSKGSRLFLGRQGSCSVPTVSAWVVGGRHWSGAGARWLSPSCLQALHARWVCGTGQRWKQVYIQKAEVVWLTL